MIALTMFDDRKDRVYSDAHKSLPGNGVLSDSHAS